MKAAAIIAPGPIDFNCRNMDENYCQLIG